MLRKVLAFKRSGREEFLFKCLKFVADADGELSDREKQLLDHISDIFRSDK
jgi:tellurite resistance protein